MCVCVSLSLSLSYAEAIEKRATGVAQITSSLPIKKPRERPAGQTRIGKKVSTYHRAMKGVV